MSAVLSPTPVAVEARPDPVRPAAPARLERLRHGSLRVLQAWLLPLALLGLWQLSADHGWVPAQILPAPSVVLATFADLFDSGELQEHTLISLQRVLWGFLAGSLGGLAFGVLIALSERARDYLQPSFNALAQVPSLGWLPFLMLLLGIDEALKIVLIGKAAFVPLAINTYDGMRGVPNRYLEVARVYRFTRLQLLRKVVLPAAFPPIWNGVRYALTHAWLALVAVELLASSEGLGFLIVYGRQLYQLDVVLAAVLVVGSIGWLLDRGLAAVETRLLHWRRDSF